ncbi:MAG: phage tail assembly protein [Desulfovibrionaceae bacterium]|nr:phage tail assembly protein [Desulfovibrionaceae bacterium]
MAFEPVTIALEDPVMLGKEEIAELTISRPIKVGDVRGIKLNEDLLTFDDLATIVSRLVSQPLPVIQKMSFADFSRVWREIQDFLSVFRETGGSE